MNVEFYPARPETGTHFAVARAGRVFEPKYNGWRALVHLPTGSVFNRHGEFLSIADKFAVAVAKIQAAFPGQVWADCEALERRHNRGKGSLIVLDLPGMSGTLVERNAFIRSKFPTTDADDCAQTDSVYSVPQFVSGEALWDSLLGRNAKIGSELYEGVVEKRADSFYPFQTIHPELTTSDWIKHRWR